MKKILSLLLAVIMLTSVALSAGAAEDKDGNWVPDNTKWDSLSLDGVKARFAIGADIHFDYYNAGSKNAYVYSALKQIGGVDAYLIAGDLTHYSTSENYQNLMASVNAYTKKNDANPNATGDSVGMTILSMGNHEFWANVDGKKDMDLEARFTEYTSQQPDALYWVNGIPVISLSPDPILSPRNDNGEIGGCYDESLEFLKGAYDKIDAEGYKGLIVMIAHHRTATDGDENNYYPKAMMDLIKAHPNTMIFTGHSHTWIETTYEFILQDGGFTQVRAGSLGNNYGGLGAADINPSTGKPSNPLQVDGDSNCSFVLVDIMTDGTARLRRIDLAKGEYMFPDEAFVVRPDVLTDYLRDDSNANYSLSYGYGAQKPSWPADAKVTVEDKGNNSSVVISFPEAIPATNLAKDFVSEYRISFKDSNGKYLQFEEKDYIRVANYRAKADEGKDWNVLIHGLVWDTDYTVEVKARTTYGKSSALIAADGTVNIGHGTATYPAVPVIDFDYSYGSAKDGAGHAMLTEPMIVEDTEVNGQKAVNLLGIGGVPYSYEFFEEDYLSIRNSFTIECYFNATDINSEQCLMGGWGSSYLGLKLKNGNICLRASFASAEGDQENAFELIPAEISANTWVHALAVYDGSSIKMYINGELAASADEYRGGLTEISYVSEPEDGGDITQLVKEFCVGAGRYDQAGDSYLMNNCQINKATLYSGAMTDEDVKNAYKVATTAMPFTDIKDGWYMDSVEYAYATGLMNGSGATTFSPSVQTSRAMIVQMLYNLEGKPEVDTKNNPFTDIPENEWYTNAVLWAYQNGVTAGTSSTTFSPNTLVNREQVAVFLYRYMRDYKKADMGEGADLSSYPDADSISSYQDFSEAVAWANANGIIGGKSNGGVVTLSPLDKAMRSEVAKMFVSFAKKFN